MHDPDAVVGVGGDAGDLAEDPFVRQRLRPQRVDLELGYGLRLLRASPEWNDCKRNGEERAFHGTPPYSIFMSNPQISPPPFQASPPSPFPNAPALFPTRL